MVAAAEEALARQRYVSPLDVLTGLGWVPADLPERQRERRCQSPASHASSKASTLLTSRGRRGHGGVSAKKSSSRAVTCAA